MVYQDLENQRRCLSIGQEQYTELRDTYFVRNIILPIRLLLSHPVQFLSPPTPLSKLSYEGIPADTQYGVHENPDLHVYSVPPKTASALSSQKAEPQTRFSMHPHVVSSDNSTELHF